MQTSGWKFSIAVLLPVIGAVVVTVGLAAAFIVWSAGRADDRSLERQQALAARIVETTKSDFESEQATEVLRPEATDAFLDTRPDMDWIESNFGEAEYDDYGHEHVYVLSPDLRPIFAARNGQKVALSAYDGDRDFVDPIAVRFRAPAMAAQILQFQNGDADWPPQLSDWVTIGGRAAMVTILPIVSNWEDQEQKAGKFYFHVAVKLLDGDLAQYTNDTYLLDGVNFDAAPDVAPGQAVVPIANQAGRFVAWFKWTPQRPGRELLAETLPASLGLLGVIGLVIAALLWGLARSTKSLEKARAEALHRATHDPLTGLANRALFTERLERSPLPLTLLALDLDRFKAVNDTLGHEAGDELLCQVAARLTPLADDSGLVARLGGDEFMVLISGPVDLDKAEALATRIVAALAEPFTLGADTAHIGVSVGIATAVTDERQELVSRADFALYDAKERGRNTYRLFDRLQQAA